MSHASLQRIGGLALVAGGFLGILALLVEPNEIALTHKAAGPLFHLGVLSGIVGGLLILAALPALYGRQSEQLGILGLAGFVGLLCTVTFCVVVRYSVLGLILPWLRELGVSAVQLDTVPVVLAGPFIAGGVLALFSTLLFAWASYSARVFSPGPSVVLLLAAVGYMAFFAIHPAPIWVRLPGILFYAAAMWYGAQLWKLAEEILELPPSLSEVRRTAALPGSAG